MMQVLTKVCDKRQLDSSQYRLRRPNVKAHLDDSLSIRLANLQNRAKLELVQLSEDEKKAANRYML